jgi:SAM-dependent methyltransferase
MHPLNASLPPCPLCGARSTAPLAHAHGRDFLGCEACGLVFVPPDQRPDPREERARYETHENDPGDPGYRAFLARLATPLVARLGPGARGLDYGSGPGPTLSVMLEEAGHPTAIWDPFFAPDPAPLAATWDFVTCTETAEHFFHPDREFERLFGLLAPGGWLALMTEPVPEDRPLDTWYYLRDPTHVVFYRERTLQWIGERFGARVERVEPRVTFFRRAASPAR